MTRPSSTLPSPGAVVGTAANGDVETCLAPEIDRGGDIVGVDRIRDQQRPAVDHRVEERTASS